MTGLWECAVCHKRFASAMTLLQHINSAHPDAAGPPLDPPAPIPPPPENP